MKCKAYRFVCTMCSHPCEVIVQDVPPTIVEDIAPDVCIYKQGIATETHWEFVEEEK